MSKIGYKNWLLSIFFLVISNVGNAQITFSYDNSIQANSTQSTLNNPWAGGLNAGQYSRIEIDGDGIEDLIIYDRTANLLNIFLYKSDKYIFSPEHRHVFPGDINGWILIKDYDCDGRKDIFTNSPQGMRVFRNVGIIGGIPEWELVADPVLTESSSGIINLQVNRTDIPAIEDIDGDGDLDILVYNFAVGGFIRHHNNRSVENTGSCQNLDFELVSRNWGGFEECDCFLYAFEEYNETCADIDPSGRVMHPGGKSLLLIDMDNDGDKDFLGGHEQCDELYFLKNNGDSVNALMVDFSAAFPDSINPANFHIFPAGYFDDFDNDGIKDLVVAPNDEYNLEFTIDQSNASWLYKNMGTNDLPEFEFQTEQFLQSGMIDVGGNAAPQLADVDGDSDLDLIIGGNGFEMGENFYGNLVLYENTGNSIMPEFTLKETDYLSIGKWGRHNIIPVIADLNHDGAEDLIIVSMNNDNRSVDMRLIKNSAFPGQGLALNPDMYTLIEVDIRQNDTPEFTDVDLDGLLDLLLGKSTGRLEYYRNSGDDSNPVFTLEEPAYLGIDDSFIEFRRNLVPCVFDVDLNGKEDLLTTDYTGEMILYYDFRDEALKSNELFYNSILEELDSLRLGYHTWMTAGLLNGTVQSTLLLGTKSGGISVLSSNNTSGIPGENEFVVNVYPNPFVDSNIISLKSNRDCELKLFNSLGQQMEDHITLKAFQVTRLELGYMPQGAYILKFTDKSGRINSEKLIRY